MPAFDPFAWAARFVAPRRLHLAIRAGGVGLFSLFVLVRLGQYREFPLKPLWAAETSIFAALLLAYVVRADPRDRSRGAREILVPLAGAAMPFALLLTPPGAEDPLLLRAVFWWMTASSAFTAWGIWTLRRSFSITVEARALVTGGPYRFVRHPVYLGEILSAAAVACWRGSALNLALFLLFVALQLWRARMEEIKLMRAFPDGFREWAAKSRWLWRG
jgi:protein-S-isoprenylcysteine O-methyltransferase Ste14